MMTFAEQFAKHQGQSIVLDGREPIPMLRRVVPPGARIRLTWRRATLSPVQGIRLRVRGGTLSLGGKPEWDDVTLWRDTAPDETVFTLSAKKSAEVRIWNCWRDDRGVMHAWIGNAAMRVTESGANSVTVECNARQAVTFEDLVFDVAIEEP
jgi:hypothetical protein